MTRHPRPKTDTDQEGGFLNRWSKRKEQARSGSPQEPEAQPEPGPEADQSSKEPVKSDADMPPLDTINERSDVSEFFSPGVSEALRNAALRKLFHSPAFNVTDGLDDYAEDFRTFAPLGNLITADMRHQMELAEERARANIAEAPESPADDPLSEGGVEEASETSSGSVTDEPDNSPDPETPNSQDDIS